jgi:mannose-6-phosphate isomerase-like protein (cupin superfamily)
MAAKNLTQEVATVSDYWSPRVVGRVNNQYVKVAKLKGELAWHKHDDEDELFLILRGQLTIQFQDREVSLEEGDFYVVPKGTMHNPIAEHECWIALVETVTTLHTGDVETPLTKSIDQQLGPGA